MESPGGEINEGDWLEPDRRPWLSYEAFALPPERIYDPVAAHLLEAAHGQGYITTPEIERLGTDLAEIVLAITGIIMVADGVDLEQAQQQIQEWQIFCEVESDDKTE